MITLSQIILMALVASAGVDLQSASYDVSEQLLQSPLVKQQK